MASRNRSKNGEGGDLLLLVDGEVEPAVARVVANKLPEVGGGEV